MEKLNKYANIQKFYENRKKFIDDGIRWAKDRLSVYGKENLLPTTKKKGLRDCINSWWSTPGECGYCYGWKDFFICLLEVTEPTGERGERKFKADDQSYRYVKALADYYGVEYSRLISKIETYNIYLLIDGKIRYRETNEEDHKAARKREEALQVVKVMTGAWYEKHGFHLNEDNNLWVNENTGMELEG